MKKLFALVLLLASFSVHAQCVVGAAGVAPVINVSFTSVTLNTDGTAVAAPVTYDVYMGTASGGETLLKAGVTSPTSINTGLAANATYYVYIVAKDSLGTVGARSNEGCKSFPKSIPGSAIITIT